MIPYPLHTRIAPTPSGWLHRGNAFSFVLTWLYARASGGTLRLRIDDLDKNRRRRAYIEDIFTSLRWLGLDWDNGPQDTDDFLQNHSQQLRLKDYQHAAEQLRTAGKLFVCTCSRKQIRAQSPSGRYPGTCRHKQLPFSTPQAAWRVRVPAAYEVSFRVWREPPARINLSEAMPDFVVRQKNERVAYMLASVVDDVRTGINFVVRGRDLYTATAAQCFLAEQLDELASFQETTFIHHPLWLDAAGEKLSKSAGATALRTMREAGVRPAVIFRRVATYLGLPPGETATDLLAAFLAPSD